MNFFSYYSWLSVIGWTIMEILPPFGRNLAFCLLLKHKGKNGNIDYRTYMRNMKKINIGDNVWINRGCRFFASHHVKDAKIVIGNNVTFGPYVTIFGAGHDYTKLSLPDTAATVKICNNVWIGGNSTILQGITIGEGAVVGAGSVVTKDVDPYTVVAGVPAKKIKERNVNENE